MSDISITERILAAISTGEELNETTIRPILDRIRQPAKIPASSIRQALLEAHENNSSLRSLRFANIGVPGQLDLADLEMPIGIRFRHCLFSEPIILDDSHLRWLNFSGSSVPGISARTLRLDGTLNLCNTTARRADDNSHNYLISLHGAAILGDIVCDGATWTNHNGPTFAADWAQIRGSIYMRGGFTSRGADVFGIVRLIGAAIQGSIEFEYSVVDNRMGASVQADGVQVGRDVVLGRGFNSSGHGLHGGVRFNGATIAGDLDCRCGSFLNDSGPALECGKINVQGHVFLSNGFRAMGNSPHAAVNFPGAAIEGSVICSGGWIRNDRATGLALKNSIIHGSICLDAGFRASGCSELGTILLSNSQIFGSVDCAGGRASNTSGSSVVFRGTNIHSKLRITEDFPCATSGELPSRPPGGWPDWAFHGIPEKRARPIAYDSYSSATWEGREIAISESWRVWLWKSEEWLTHGAIDLDGATYSGIPEGAALETWIRWLTSPIHKYSPQAYQQLSDSYRKAGHEREARIVRIVQHKDLVKRGNLRLSDRITYRIMGGLLGYGYRPFLALAWLALLFTMTFLLTSLFLAPNRIVTDISSENKDQNCSFGRQMTYAATISVPLLSTESDNVCKLQTERPDAPFWIAVQWLIKLSGWSFATLFIAGFTGVVRKN